MAQSIKIIQNAIIVPCEPQARLLRMDLLVKDDRIAEISNRGEIMKSLYPNAEVIDAAGKVLLPGFVDAHYHGESFVLKQFTQLFPLSRWSKEGSLRRILPYLYGEATKDELVVAFRSAYFAALKSGVTTLGEYGFDNLDVPFQASFESLRRTDLRGLLALHNGDQVERAKGGISPFIKFAVALPPEEDLTTYNLQSTLRIARENNWPVVVHYGETQRAVETIRRNFNKLPMEVLAEYRVFDYPVQLTHLSVLEGQELSLIAGTRLPLVVTPASILTKATDVPPLAAFFQYQIPLALGSDWGHSDPFENMRAFIALAASQRLDAASPSELLRMHTINAARSLGMDHEIGTLTVGKKADIAFVDIGDLRLASLLANDRAEQFIADLVQHATSRDVSDVMINGEFFLRKGQVMTYSEDDLKTELSSLTVKLQNLLPSVKNSTEAQVTPITGSSSEMPSASLSDVEEGFRIVRRGIDQEHTPATDAESTKVIPLNPEKPKEVELPKTVRKVFGDDDF
ncbi:MAG TPA: amidohydrolase family protein [Bacteroidota bacterium]|nr:amidohydrolase family protein [Bacteroidota bacterium]